MPSRIQAGKKYCSIWVEIHGFTPNSTGHEILLKLGIISMALLPFLAVFLARSNLTGHEILLKMGVNSLGLHLYASLVELGIIPMNSTGFRPGKKYCSNWVEIHGFTPHSTGHEILLKLGIIPMNSTGFTPIFSNISCLVEFERARNTAQFGLKFMDLLPIQLGMKYCSNWVSSLWLYSHF